MVVFPGQGAPLQPCDLLKKDVLNEFRVSKWAVTVFVIYYFQILLI
jgi:hypothetical protein